MALDIAHVIWGYGSAAADYGNFAPSLALFGLGLVLFTAHYLVLRGFYALEQTRRVFWIQCVIAATNIAAAVLLTRGAPPSETAPRLVLAYACSYARRRGRLLRAALARRSVAWPVAGCSASWSGSRSPSGSARRPRGGCARLLDELVPGRRASWHAVLDLAVVGLVYLALYLGLARMLRITEVNDVMALVTRRLSGRR